MTYAKRIEIDFLRGLFALLIVVGHIIPYFNNNSNVHFFGTNWVVGFVILSGYLIETSVSKNLKNNNFTIKTYIFLRTSRIIPLYLLIILISILVYFILIFFDIPSKDKLSSQSLAYINNFEFKNLIGQIFFLSNVIVGFGTFGFLVATPTLIYEFWFYTLWILRFFFLKYFLYSLLFFLLIIKFYFKIVSLDFLIFLFIWFSGTYLCSFKNRFYKSNISLLGYISLFCCTSLYLFDFTNAFLKTLHLYFFHEYFIFIIPFSLIILGKNKIFIKKSYYLNKLILLSNWLGKISYTVFLFHTFIIFSFFILIEKYSLNKILNSQVIIFFIMFIVVISSHFISVFLEKPLMIYRDKFKKKLKLININPNYYK
jgi:peptidoglycan/LPS O-acetylase OafA/YrhL